ncbi:MAG TPA: hypothetical protein VGF48_23285 [Thermoanaerobaculia bacterium]|jgi:hypothetical protein
MAIEFRTTEVIFPEGKRKAQTQRGSVTFDSRVRAADAAIKGFELGYTEGDHELLLAQIGITDVKKQGDDVTFTVTIGLRDNSGDYDDPFDGKVTVLVTADTTGDTAGD